MDIFKPLHYQTGQKNVTLKIASLRLSIAATLTLVLMALPDTASWAQSGTGTIKGGVQEVVTYSDASNHAQSIVDRLEQSNQLAGDTVKKISIVKANDLNAATDGQQIMFSSALWNLLKSDDQRAFVISHELSHITLNHVGKTQVRQVGFGLLNYFLNRRTTSSQNVVGSQLLQVATAAGLTLVDNKFSRETEYQADDRGLQMMSKAGYRASAAMEVFEIFEKNMPGGTPEFLRSHPLNKSRIAALSKKYPQ